MPLLLSVAEFVSDLVIMVAMVVMVVMVVSVVMIVRVVMMRVFRAWLLSVRTACLCCRTMHTWVELRLSPILLFLAEVQSACYGAQNLILLIAGAYAAPATREIFWRGLVIDESIRSITQQHAARMD